MTARLPKGLLAAALLVVGLAGTSAADVARAEPVKITLVTTNDMDRMEEKDGRGGFARLAAVLAAERATNPHVLFIHAGDAISPSLLSTFDQGAHVMALLNQLRPDVFVPGNHEFDFGPKVFAERMAQAHFPVLAANLRTVDGRRPDGITAGRILVVDGLTIGIVGVTLDDVPELSSPGDYRFLPPLQVAEELAADLRRQGAQLIIAVAHVGLQQDLEFLRSGAFDVVVSGHDHLLTTLYDGRSLLSESGAEADRVKVLTLTVEAGEKGVRWTPDLRVVDTAKVTPDPDIARQVAAYEEKLSGTLDVELGMTSTRLDSRRIEVRSRETAIGNLIADAMREMTGADIALINGGGIRGNKVYPPGSKLTARDILSELPFGNRTLLLEVSGAELRAALENGLSQVADAAGRFPQVSGMTVLADLSQPVGQRVQSIKVKGLPLDPKARYTLATNDFLARGGDGYDMLSGAKVVVSANDAGLMANQVIAYIRSIGYVAPQIEGRLQLQ
ncbi:2',3'-cyclic-nucleotide 2'-phosphodiesterase/5'-or 3'-nucleotidase, 5'-nucleotidase family [Tistlia consotensis]|uniref:2',3'-cyclic-nucleotide 2'-phosphodiesterase/5'-or 3'-nucleotidase, 5'-nucleotidase family n=1 Tax=Tistlia consotensis USBA 355 TaxID=560819 RepID=A0A1Y6CA65_9PROT|nr:bifunctional UDP-sugar hydrolase/5'-nucleotidase [Tistlia consotensis]SMF53983.1 2',3'-cyclic-nucleotide 2'-phosphodiesterase/5'-or 3'-nucleotidase, 5'-nucleotidase family [Tistlia consotensis USBA 355]SNR86335.1 2',3'-cyclic-nucleotide 2'-phosphodiesterase/5'-or 3'-nucleotidase, 5'-nucleotidase family [Tistlia consotensis]